VVAATAAAPAHVARAADPWTVYAVGDICSDPTIYPADTACDDVAVALLPTTGTDALITLGDHQYTDNTIAKFNARYRNNFGNPARKALTRPTTGNHEYYDTAPTLGYCSFFGAPACTSGPSQDPTWYSWDLGVWHFVSVDSMQSMAYGSDQYNFVDADLTAHAAQCKIVYFHHPHYTSGSYYPSADWQVDGLQDLWDDLYANRVDIVLNGHDHVYERFAKQDSAGGADPAAGARQFTVGTGGASQYGFSPIPLANTQFRYNETPGVLKLSLHQSYRAYDWAYRTMQGGTPVVDSGVNEPCN
jgi:hypothetical protein